LNTKRIVDIYFDTLNADLIERGIYVRLRNNQKIDIKFNRACLDDPTLELQPYCEEYSFILPFSSEQLPLLNTINTDLKLKHASSFEEYKTVNNLIDHRTVDKTRTTYSIEDFVISIDEVKGLGKFLEIELMDNKTDALDAVTKRMKEILSSLELKPLKTGYDSLMLRKQNFQQYLRGRFVLPEDKALYSFNINK
jgi:adenylate cyclase, class 2